jgi:hypothetical protein
LHNLKFWQRTLGCICTFGVARLAREKAEREARHQQQQEEADIHPAP